MSKSIRNWMSASVILVAMLLAGCSDEPTPSPVPTATPTATATATPTPIPTATPTVTAAATPTQIPTPTPIPTVTPVPTPTPISTVTPVPTPTPTPTRTPWPALPPEPTVMPYSELVELSEVQNYGLLTSEEARIIHDLAWFGDGIDVHEKPAADILVSLAVFGPEAFSILIDKPWVQDGINPRERRVLWSLTWNYLHRMGEEFTSSVANMPFLDTFEPADRFAFTSLTELMLRGTDDRHFQEIWGHPAVSDGIDDHDAETLAKLLVVGWDAYDPESLESLEALEPQQFEVERRSISLPLAGEVEINIQRRRGTAEWAMDHIETSLLLLEEFMSTPMPYERVDFVISDNIQELATQGGGGEVLIGPRHIDRRSTYLHELAHFYWGFGAPWWIVEGAASFLEDVWNAAQDGTPLVSTRLTPVKCQAVVNFKQLESTTRDLGTSVCAYSMGAHFFSDLHRTVGELYFRTGFRRLYLLSRQADPRDGCHGIVLNICHVRVAFTSDLPEETAAMAREVIDEWYEGDARLRLHSHVRGFVVGADGEPVAGVKLHLLSAEDGSGHSATSGMDGFFSFPYREAALNLRVDALGGCDYPPWFDGQGLSQDVRDAADLIVDGSRLAPLEVRVPITGGDIYCGWKAIRGIVLRGDGTPGLSEGAWIRIKVYEVGASNRVAFSQHWIWPDQEVVEFEVRVPDGTHTLLVQNTTKGRNFGWYDGKGVTLERNKATHIEVDGADVEGLRIRLSNQP